MTIEYIGNNPSYKTNFLEGLFDASLSKIIEVNESTAISLTIGDNCIWKVVEKPVINNLILPFAENISTNGNQSNTATKTTKKTKKNDK